MGVKDSDILVSCSDYHIFKKLNKTRKQAMEMYLGVVKWLLSMIFVPAVILDITLADFYGFVVPLLLS